MPARRLQLAALALELLEQLGVLDRQHRLVGQGLDELDRLRGECARGLAAEHERPDQTVLAQQGQGENGAIAGAHDVLERVARLVVDVGDLHRGALQASEARGRPTTVPMIVFILPVLFIVLIGPAVIKVMDTLL